MKAAGQINETDNTGGAPVDPFAVDFFGGAASIGDDEPEPEVRVARIRRRRASDWHRVLPKLSNADAGFSYALDGFTPEITTTACETAGLVLGRFLRGGDAVECRIVSVTETSLAETLKREAPGRVVIELAAGRAGAAIVIDSGFAGAIVDSMLGGETAGDGLRNLTAAETAVVEFVAAGVVNALNELEGNGRIELRGAGPARTDVFQPGERGAEIVVEINSDGPSGIVSILATPAFMRAIGSGTVRSRTGISFADAEISAREIGLFVQAGTTMLDAGSLAFLEADDIVIVDRPRFASADSFDGDQTVLVGRGGNVRLRGVVSQSGTGAILTVADIFSETARRKFTPVKFMMDQFSDSESEEAGVDGVSSQDVTTADVEEQLAPALENIQVALRVEIAGNRISLRELQDLRPGQIVGLGCSPNDPVRLVTDSSDEPVAIGELVEIEGQLGVRLTKVFV